MKKSQGIARKVLLVCCACLSKERSLFRLCRIPDGVNLMYLLSCCNSQSYIHKDEMSKMMVCWECKAMVLRIRRFMRQVSEAQRLLKVSAKRSKANTEQRLSRLACYYITGYDTTIQYKENPESLHNFINCSTDDLIYEYESSDVVASHSNDSDEADEQIEVENPFMDLDDEPEVESPDCTAVTQDLYMPVTMDHNISVTQDSTSLTPLTPECCTSVTPLTPEHRTTPNTLTPNVTLVTSEPCESVINLKHEADTSVTPLTPEHRTTPNTLTPNVTLVTSEPCESVINLKHEADTSVTPLTPEHRTTPNTLTPNVTLVTSEPCESVIDLKHESDTSVTPLTPERCASENTLTPKSESESEDDGNCVLESDHSIDNTEDFNSATNKSTEKTEELTSWAPDNKTKPKSRIPIVRLERYIMPQESKEHSHTSVTSNYTRSLKLIDGNINKYKCLLSPKRYMCNICGRKVGSAQALASHIKSHGQCAICSEWLQTKTELRNHYQHVHNIEIKYLKQDTFECDFCGKNTATKRALVSHVKSHRQCTVCQKWLVSKAELKSHMALCQNDIEEKSKENTFVCDFCGKNSATKHDLISHVKSHRQCMLCEKWLNTKRQLDSQINSDQISIFFKACPYH